MDIGKVVKRSTDEAKKNDEAKKTDEPKRFDVLNKPEVKAKVVELFKKDDFTFMNKLTKPAVSLTGGPPPTAPAASPEVQKAADEINRMPEHEQANVLASNLQDHSTGSPEDAAFRKELMNTLGADRVSEMLKELDKDRDDQFPSTARKVLSAAGEAYSPADQGKLVKSIGSYGLSKVMAAGVNRAGDPTLAPDDAAQARREMENVSKLVGNLSTLPSGAAGKAEGTVALMLLQNGKEDLLGQTPGVSAAAWVVAHSGNDAFKLKFAQQYLDKLKAPNGTLKPEEARAAAWALGSISSEVTALTPLTTLTEAQRKAFLGKLGEGKYLYTPELETGFNFQQDAKGGVNDFLDDVARLNPSMFKNPQAAKDLRIETFQAVTNAVDSNFFSDDKRTHVALANMFAADTAGIVNASSFTDSTHFDPNGHTLAKFFDHVAFRDPSSSNIVTTALQRYIGVGPERGLADFLSESKGDTAFMRKGGNEMAHNLGFVLGAFYQGTKSALDSMRSDDERKKAIVTVVGKLAENLIDVSPVKGAYAAVKKGTADQVTIDKVFGWLADRFVGNTKADQDASKQLSAAIIDGALDPFFGQGAIHDADPQEWLAMLGEINAGVSRGVGNDGDPSINIGGAPQR